MLAVELLWVVIGAIYVVYKCCKEGEYTPLCAAVSFVTVIGFSYFLITLGVPKLLLGFVYLSIPIAIILLIPSFLDRKNGIYSKKKEKQISEDNEIRLQGLMMEFKDAGYHISDELFEISFNQEKRIYELEYCDAINEIRNHVNLYNRKMDCPATIQEIYESCSQHQRSILNYCSSDILCGVLGTSIKAIPMSQATREDVRQHLIKKAETNPKSTKYSIAFNATCMITMYDIQIESKRQQKEALIEIILQNLGLKYPESEIYNLPSKTYRNEIRKAISDDSGK